MLFSRKHCKSVASSLRWFESILSHQKSCISFLECNFFIFVVISPEKGGINMGEILNKAIVYAVKVHNGQVRKGTQVPYILHPLEAASIVGTLTTDKEVIATAVLHDVVEDTAATTECIQEAFGERIAALVAAESENKREDLPAGSTWKIRKQETIDHLRDASIEVKMLTLGDKLSNIRSLYRDQLVYGERLWQRFNQKDKQEHYWYYKRIAECLTELKNHCAYAEYAGLVEKTFKE
jgi:guanosine-3',5'-bis(diphosphate) 3'-pyrophosphohydrolase